MKIDPAEKDPPSTIPSRRISGNIYLECRESGMAHEFTLQIGSVINTILLGSKMVGYRADALGNAMVMDEGIAR